HPSVVGWSLGNEYESWAPEGIAWTRDMAQWVKAIDPTRPVTFAALGRELRELAKSSVGAERAFDQVDFIAANIYFPLAELPQFLDPVHARWPDKPVLITEYGLRADRVKSEQERIEHFDSMLAYVRERPWICGFSYWSFNDYASRYPGTSDDGFRRWGLVDEFRRPRPLYEHMRTKLSDGT
ncbi:MAG: glycoside hydrolase family 2 TIM barrel-domain containing protein, partial [Lacunisphaera sp.]|nr:glycoside hydrolase family 2 TIM barrel-domain containing protein [Lacunisphaera sp.]